MRTTFLAALLSLLAFVSPAFGEETIKLGAVLSVTGPASFLGEPEKNTLLMLQDRINAAGGLLGRVTKVAESFVSLEVSSGVEVQCQRSAVVQVLPKGSIK